MTEIVKVEPISQKSDIFVLKLFYNISKNSQNHKHLKNNNVENGMIFEVMELKFCLWKV